MKKNCRGESRGESVGGGKTFTLHPRDLVTIPAGMPHWLQLSPIVHFQYLLFKTKEPG